jgi:hypothetical protein
MGSALYPACSRLMLPLGNCRDSQGDKNGENFGLIRLVRAVLVGFSYKIH